MDWKWGETDAPVKDPLDRYKKYNASPKGRERHRQYDASPKGGERRRKYDESSKGRERVKRYEIDRSKIRHDTSSWESDAKYLGRPIVAWDGEGVSNPDGSHDYIMLAGRLESGEGEYLRGTYKESLSRGGLSTVECLECILNFAEVARSLTDDKRGPLHIIYGGSYDVNMMLRDLPRIAVERLYSTGTVRWNAYRLAWRPGKSFTISRLREGKRETVKGSSVTVFDVVSFFQTSFVKACDAYLGDRFADRDNIVANKAARGSFTREQALTVKDYNDSELQNLCELFRELRLRLNRVHLRPRRWDGPGAVAASLMMRERVKEGMAKCPPGPAKAARFAYAGGRFEVIRFGHVMDKAYEYDVNSAYPNALRNVPNLARGRWRHVEGDPGYHPFALYHIESASRDFTRPAPLFRRDPNGTVCYPLDVIGWYWSPEYRVWDLWRQRGYGTGRVRDAWIFEEVDPTDRPFGFIEPLYRKRQALKRGKDGAHVGIKLALNSLYGKCAQQIGWRVDEKGILHTPPFHQLEWAGYATSHCRAAVFEAAMMDIDNVIAFETDAVFMAKPIPVQTGEYLGEWECVEFENLTYAQSGTYFGYSIKDGQVDKTRGVDRGTLDRGDVIAAMSAPIAVNRQVTATLTRFNGAGIALAQQWSKWRRWESIVKNVTVEPTGKRVHLECAADGGNRLGQWHETACLFVGKEHSRQFPIEWINPDGSMVELEELRREENDYAV